MLMKKKGQRIIGFFLGMTALLGVLAAMHTGLDVVYQPNCPACQQEMLNLFVPEPAVLYFLPKTAAPQERRVYLTCEFPPRSPPIASAL